MMQKALYCLRGATISKSLRALCSVLVFTFLSFALALSLVACAQPSNTTADAQPGGGALAPGNPEQNPVHPVPGDGEPSTGNPPSTTNYDAALWGKVANSAAWTDAVLAAVRTHLPELERGRDRNEFCPDYSVATEHQRETCWLRLVSAVAQFESSFNPGDMFMEANGKYSVGLLSLSASECPNAPTIAALKSPIKNLVCGVNIMARLIEHDGFIDGPASARGASSYWSTLRTPYSSGHYHVGRKNQVIAITRLYRNF
jgi:hypothetical protein